MSSDSPASIVFDINGNPIGSVYDGIFYRFQTDTRITDGYSFVEVSNTSGQKSLKIDLVDNQGRDVGLTNRSGTAILSSVNAIDSDILIITANPLRRGLIIYNDSNSPLRISYGTTPASLTSFSDYLSSQETFHMEVKYYGEIRGIWETATGAARITELT